MAAHENRKFGRIKSPFDHRDWVIGDTSGLEVRDTKLWATGKVLNQEDTPHCVGFAAAGFKSTAPVMTLSSDGEGHDIYYRCKEIDGDPGAEDGTWARSACQVLKERGDIPGYAWVNSIDAAISWILTKGPLLACTNWYEDMNYPQMTGGYLKPTGQWLGGHGYLLTGYWKKYDAFQMLNSWGEDWGFFGIAYIKRPDFEKLWLSDGELLAMVEKTTPMHDW